MKRGLLIIAGIAAMFLVVGFVLYEPTCDNDLYRSLHSACFAPR